MNRFLPILVALCLMASCVTTEVGAQQTPANTQCNDEAVLSWNMNPEADMGHYNVYASNNPIDPTVDNTALILMQVPHPAPGATEVTHPLNSNLSEGDKYFRVSAVDTPAVNEGPLSLEVGCNYNLIPTAPNNVQIILTLAVTP